MRFPRGAGNVMSGETLRERIRKCDANLIFGMCISRLSIGMVARSVAREFEAVGTQLEKITTSDGIELVNIDCMRSSGLRDDTENR